MARIIAAKIETQDRAEAIKNDLHQRGFDASDVEVIYVNPPGQHATYHVGGDMQADPGAKDASKGQAAGVAAGAAVGALVGAAATVVAPVVAPAVVAGLTGVGAHVGGLAGAMSRTREPEDEQAAKDRPDPGPEALDTRRGGLMIAVNLGDRDEHEIVELLRDAGATEIEHAEGTWKDGDWVDFDPISPPEQVEPEGEPR